MANPNVAGPLDISLDEYNLWKDYNNPGAPEATAAEFAQHWQTHADIITLARPPPALARQPPRPIGPVSRPPPESIASLSQQKQLFLNTIPPGLASAQSPAFFWKGIKILGEGGNGIVGLFQFDPLAPNPPVHSKVAVKLNTTDVSILDEEATMMRNCRLPSLSDHIVEVLTPPSLFVPGLQRLILEYCPQGSLEGLINRRIQRNLPFEEITLWRIFECLVDACSVMQNGQEFDWDPVNNCAVINNPIANRLEMVHLDVKPDNIVLSERNTAHPMAPICKFTDFAHSWELDPTVQGAALDQQKLAMRETGTPDYYPPEQFSETWNASDWRVTGIAGEFSTATNVWGLGAIMYQLICMKSDPPNHLTPFRPDYDLNGSPARGNTYGPETQIQNYSATLRDMIQECLYEMPALRCRLVDMKTTIRRQINAHFRANNNNHVGEDWEDLEVPEPTARPGLAPVAPIFNAPRVMPQIKYRQRMGDPVQRSPAILMKRFCTAYIPALRRCCKNQINCVALPPPRCNRHQDLSRWLSPALPP
ncbi:hypothetical protein JHW43_006981 [Diplocarpon mali]|nr:hypothetical protein JHW43_006981 [Diplocarpon mali]